jgi:lipopolysaccharide/colanic/teichoic acid biosynthesis glycosyltransferase
MPLANSPPVPIAVLNAKLGHAQRRRTATARRVRPIGRRETRPATPVRVPPQRLYLAISRAIDLVVAAIALAAALPIILASAIAIKLNSPGPVFFRQARAGRNGHPFNMFKLRSMYAGADDDKELFRTLNHLPTGPCFKMKNDPRVTTVGRWLRRSSIDELPQLWNVIKGDMALVGPRPLPLDEARADTVEMRLRLAARPGITCLWQVSGRTEIPFEEWLALDLWYIRNRSLSLDLQILIKTIPAVLSARGAY